MPELPDVTVYVESIAARVAGEPLQRIRVASPFVVRTFDPPLAAAAGKRVQEVRRLGKRIVFVLEDGLFLVVHLMVAGRFKWLEPGAKIPGKVGLAAFDFPSGTLLLTEAATKKRASIHLRGRSLDEFDAVRHRAAPLLARGVRRGAPTREPHAQARAHRSAALLGIGNAYSDEILHRAKLSPAR